MGSDGERAAERTIAVLENQIGAHNLAALVIEPIQGEGGFIVPAPGFLPALLSWCRDNDVVFIADEVQTGFARTGAMFACEHEPIEPDLICTAKGIGGGLPLAAVTGRAEIMDAPHVSGLGGTFGGNPLACAAALGRSPPWPPTIWWAAPGRSSGWCSRLGGCRPTMTASPMFAAAAP